MLAQLLSDQSGTHGPGESGQVAAALRLTQTLVQRLNPLMLSLGLHPKRRLDLDHCNAGERDKNWAASTASPSSSPSYRPPRIRLPDVPSYNTPAPCNSHSPRRPMVTFHAPIGQ